MNKIIHAILIDTVARAIKVVQLGEDHLQSAYDLIGCELIEAATRLPNGDVLYVDEEALVRDNPPEGSFMFQGRVFKGNGLIVNESGEEWTAPHSPVIQLFQAIVLKEPKKVAGAAQGGLTPLRCVARLVKQAFAGQPSRWL